MLTLSILLFCPAALPNEADVEDFALPLSLCAPLAQEPPEEPAPEEEPPEEVVEEVIEEEEIVEEVIDEDEIIDEEFGDEEEEELTPEEAIELLETALKANELDLIYTAIEDAGRIADKGVVKLLGKAVKHKDHMVRMDALQALRFNEDPNAFKELLKLKKYKPIVENEESAEAYYLALGQKANVKALAVLTDKLHITNRGDKATRARILAIGRIRDPKAVDALMSMLTSGAARRRHPNIKEIHLCLTVLTGAEVKANTDSWLKWWNENKKGLKISKEEQEATTKRSRATWKALWADPEDAELMKEALKRGRTDFADADEEEMKRLRERAEERKKEEEGADDDDDDGTKDDG